MAERKAGTTFQSEGQMRPLDPYQVFRNRTERWYGFSPDKGEMKYIVNCIVDYLHAGHISSPKATKIQTIAATESIWKVTLRNKSLIVLYRGQVAYNLIPLPSSCVSQNNAFIEGSIDLEDHKEVQLPLQIPRD